MRQTLILGILTAFNVLVTFFYQYHIVSTIGPGTETDSLFASMVVPQLILAVVSGSLSYVIIPLLSSTSGEGFGQELWNLFRGIFFLFTALAVLLFISASHWVPLTVPGFNLSAKNLTVSLTRIQLIGLSFTGFSGLLTAAYHAQHRFIWASLAPGLSAIIGLIFLIWYLPLIGVASAAWAMTIKMIFQAILLAPILGPYQASRSSSSTFKTVWVKIKPLLFGNVYSKTDQLVDRFLSSMAPAGDLSLLHLSQLAYGAGNQIINSSAVAPLVPTLAQKAAGGDWETFRDLSKRRFMMVTAFTLITFIGFITFGEYSLGLSLKSTSFTDAEINTLWRMLVALVGVWVGGAMGQVLSSSFYAKRDTKTPTIIGVYGFTIGIVLKFVGFYSFGVIGIALGTSVYYFINAIALYVSLYRKNF